LLKRLTDVSQKYSESAVDNRVLKADVETLRAKVMVLLYTDLKSIRRKPTGSFLQIS